METTLTRLVVSQSVCTSCQSSKGQSRISRAWVPADSTVEAELRKQVIDARRTENEVIVDGLGATIEVENKVVSGGVKPTQSTRRALSKRTTGAHSTSSGATRSTSGIKSSRRTTI